MFDFDESLLFLLYARSAMVFLFGSLLDFVYSSNLSSLERKGLALFVL